MPGKFRLKLRPPFLVQPGLSLRAKLWFRPMLLDVRPKSLGAGDNGGRIDTSPDRGLEFQPRGLFRVREAAAVRIDLPEGLKLTVGAILDLLTRARASGASG